MKRRIVYSFFLLCFLTQTMVKAQVTVLEVGERLPNLYYYDTNWIDYKLLTHFGNDWAYIIQLCFTCSIGDGGSNSYDMFIGRPCITNTPLSVIGLAGLALTLDKGEICYGNPDLANASSGSYIIDTVNRLPEYFYLYQVEGDSLHLRDSLRFDTATVNYRAKLPIAEGLFFDSIFKLYEVYFDKPIPVHDTFVVGGTTHNNMLHGKDEELLGWNDAPLGLMMNQYRPTKYAIGVTKPLLYEFYPPNPPYCYVHYYKPYPYVYTAETFQGLTSQQIALQYENDTNGFQKKYFLTGPGFGDVWLPFFAILDTNFDYDACMGVTTTGLHVEGMDSTSASIAWDDSGVGMWQVEIKEMGQDSSALMETPINYMEVDGLEMGQCYSVRVRTLCDTDLLGDWYIHGAWSDWMTFCIPIHFDTCMVPTGLHVKTMDSASVTLGWDDAEVLSWKVQTGLVELGMTNGQTLTATTNEKQVDGLYTHAWYWARVQAICDTDWISDWTDTVRFYVSGSGSGPDNPDTNGNDTTTVVNPVEQYTYLMPNPAREGVMVMSSFMVKKVELYASDGKLLKEQEVNAVGTNLSLEGLPAGLYFVRVRTASGMTTKRLVIQP